LLPKPMRLDSRDRRQVATMDMPSFCCIESARRPAERAKPTKMTNVSGATVFDFRGWSPMRWTETTRTEKGRRLFASLLFVSWCAMRWAWSEVRWTRAPPKLGSYGEGSWGSYQTLEQGTHQTMFPIWLILSLKLPENMPDTLPGTGSSTRGLVGLISA
jgi:hypothetical protein